MSLLYIFNDNTNAGKNMGLIIFKVELKCHKLVNVENSFLLKNFSLDQLKTAKSMKHFFVFDDKTVR